MSDPADRPAAPGRRAFLRGRLFRAAPRPDDAGAGAAPPGPAVAILPSACLAYAGVLCDLCVTACGAKGALRLQRGRPVVVPDRCDGCAACLPVCPAPTPALRVTPAPAV